MLPDSAFEAIFAEHERDHQDAGASRAGCNGCAMLQYASDLRTQVERAEAKLEGDVTEFAIVLAQRDQAEARARRLEEALREIVGCFKFPFDSGTWGAFVPIENTARLTAVISDARDLIATENPPSVAEEKP